MNKSGQGGFDLESDKRRALALTPVSRETEKRLDMFVELLLLWQRKFNLVASSTLPAVWTRHVADSLQLLPLAPQARVWVDFGSGAGFPGIPLACALADQPDAMVHLIESNGKKASFLREAVRSIALPARVHPEERGGQGLEQAAAGNGSHRATRFEGSPRVATIHSCNPRHESTTASAPQSEGAGPSPR